MNNEKLSIKEQLLKDIMGYNQQILDVLPQVNLYFRFLGAKEQAEGILKKLDKDK